MTLCTASLSMNASTDDFKYTDEKFADIQMLRYKVTDFYHPNDEGGLLWSDPDIGVEWPVPEGMELIFSEKDTKWPTLKERDNA